MSLEEWEVSEIIKDTNGTKCTSICVIFSMSQRINFCCFLLWLSPKQTALYIAACTNQASLVKLFIEKGADVNLFAEVRDALC